MSIKISTGAASWFSRELELVAGDYIRFFPRYSSGGGLHPGFSLGIAKELPRRPAIEIKQENVVFFMEEQDLWYMDGYDLFVEYVEGEDDIEYKYEAKGTNNV